MKISLILANDDKDDCLIFQEALDEIKISTSLTTAHDGVQLLQLLNNGSGLIPDLIFLDLNMPRKNGFTTLKEIKSIERLRSIPVIIFSTSYDEDSADLLRAAGALRFICIPANFPDLKKVITEGILLVTGENSPVISKGNFCLNPGKTKPLKT